jgi:hypothetical protein
LRLVNVLRDIDACAVVGRISNLQRRIRTQGLLYDSIPRGDVSILKVEWNIKVCQADAKSSSNMGTISLKSSPLRTVAIRFLFVHDALVVWNTIQAHLHSQRY